MNQWLPGKLEINLKMYAILWKINFCKTSKVPLTMITSMGMGTGSLALNLSFTSFTMNTITMITMDITRSQILVEVIWTKIFSRVCAKEANTVYSKL